MGNRYLEVFEARYSEMSWMLTKNVDKDPKDTAEYEEFVSCRFWSLNFTIPTIGARVGRYRQDEGASL